MPTIKHVVSESRGASLAHECISVHHNVRQWILSARNQGRCTLRFLRTTKMLKCTSTPGPLRSFSTWRRNAASMGCDPFGSSKTWTQRSLNDVIVSKIVIATYDAATVLVTVTSQVVLRPSRHEIDVNPSGRFPSVKFLLITTRMLY